MNTIIENETELPETFLRRQKIEVHGFRRNADELKLAKCELREQRARQEQDQAEQRGKLSKKLIEENLSGLKDDWETVCKSKDPMSLGKNIVKFVMGFRFLNDSSNENKQDSSAKDEIPKAEPFEIQVKGTALS